MEMLLVLALIGVAASIVSFGAFKMLREQRFRSGVDLLIDKMQMAQEIMLVFKTDVNIVLDGRSGSEIKYRIESDRKLPREISSTLHLPETIPGIHSLSFEDARHGFQQGVVEIKFSANAMSTSKGTLVLATDSLKRRIDLPGYPYPIGTDVKDLQNDVYSHESERLYPHQIRENWMHKQQEKKNKKDHLESPKEDTSETSK